MPIPDKPMISSSPNSIGPMIDHFSAEASEQHILYFINKIEAKLRKPIGESGLAISMPIAMK